MKIRVFAASQLSADLLAAWTRLQMKHVALASPFFRPEFTQAVAAVRDGVEVAMFEDAGRPVAFFPYERMRRNSGGPVGGLVSDFHGVIAGPDFVCDPIELLRACGLSSWRFRNLPRSQRSFRPFAWKEVVSPYIELSDGFEAYIDRRDNGRRLLAFYRKKRRNIEREFGPIRFEPRVKDRAILATCIQWKIDQYRRANACNVLGLPWVVRLLEKVFDADRENFSPMVAVMYAGDRIAAIDIGMRSGHVWHSWFPAYNLEMQKHSPGILHLIEMMMAAPALGVRRIDLGKGDEPYKFRYASGVDYVVEGALHVRPLRGLIDHAAYRVKNGLKKQLRSSWLQGPARRARRAMFSTRNWLGRAE